MLFKGMEQAGGSPERAAGDQRFTQAVYTRRSA
ncbi:hypothetical protein FHS64_002540 [Brevundimonas terrae]|nr:hypothetical protein [Brevundimonas terrae]